MARRKRGKEELKAIHSKGRKPFTYEVKYTEFPYGRSSRMLHRTQEFATDKRDAIGWKKVIEKEPNVITSSVEVKKLSKPSTVSPRLPWDGLFGHKESVKPDWGVLNPNDVRLLKVRAKSGRTVHEIRRPERTSPRDYIIETMSPSGKYRDGFVVDAKDREDALRMAEKVIGAAPRPALIMKGGKEVLVDKDSYRVKEVGASPRGFDFNRTGRYLYNPATNMKYSGNAGDYWDVPADKVLEEEGTQLWLKDSRGNTLKETVQKKDLVDDIYEAQRAQRNWVKDRKSVGCGRKFSLMTESGKEYIIDEKGRMTQAYRYAQDKKDFSGQWLLSGLTNWRGRKIFNWNAALGKDLDIKALQKAMRSKIYVEDLDNGTARGWSDPVRSIKEIKY